MPFGKQIWYCTNCGRQHYDTRITMKYPMLCDQLCRNAWEHKYAASILQKDGPEPVFSHPDDLMRKYQVIRMAVFSPAYLRDHPDLTEEDFTRLIDEIVLLHDHV